MVHPVERVWPKLTEPDRLATWSPVGPDRPLTTLTLTGSASTARIAE
jgi:uncharacterized protein YndB with AHSA1/START domain